MKTIITLFCFLFIATISYSQTVVFGDMETWRSPSVGFPPTQLDVVNGWNCPDSLAHAYSFVIGGASRQLYKSTDKHGGNFAARIVSQNQGTLGDLAGVLTNAVINVDIVNQDFTLVGGTSVYGRVNYVNAWLKYNPQGGDTAVVSVEAMVAGVGGVDSVIGDGSYIITSAQPYTLITVPITYDNATVQPQKLQVVFTSSAGKATIGSELFIDDVSYSIFPAGIGNAKGDEDVVEVYPNPSVNTLYLTSKVSAQMQLTIYNQYGQQVLQKSFGGKTNVDIAALPSGNYLYTITDNTGNLVQRKGLVIAK